MLSFPSQNDKKKFFSDQSDVLKKNRPGWRQINKFLSLA